MKSREMIRTEPLRDHVAAISCGIYGGTPVLDLDYAEDSAADTDANFVHDRQRRHRRDPGHGGEGAVQRRRSSWTCWRWRAKGIGKLVDLQKTGGDVIPARRRSSPSEIREFGD